MIVELLALSVCQGYPSVISSGVVEIDHAQTVQGVGYKARIPLHTVQMSGMPDLSDHEVMSASEVLAVPSPS